MREFNLWIPLDELTANEWKLYFPFKTVHHLGRKIDFTPERGAEMVGNFQAHVPDYPLPINSLHRDDLGVFGEIADLRMSDQGVEWLPHFYEGAVDILKSKGYRYASPEINPDNYTGVYDGKKYSNVALGIAITPRPRLGKDTQVFSDGKLMAFEMTSEEIDEMRKQNSARWSIEELLGAIGVLRRVGRNPEHKMRVEQAVNAIKPIISSTVSELDEVVYLEQSTRDKAKVAQQTRSKRWGITVREDGHITKPGKWNALTDSQFADPVNYLFPVHDAAHTRNAASRFAQFGKAYNSKSRGVVRKRIDTARKKFKIGEKNMSEMFDNDAVVEKLGDRLVALFTNLIKPQESTPSQEPESTTETDAAVAELQEQNAELEIKLQEYEAAKVKAEEVAFEERQKARLLEFAEVAKDIAGLPEKAGKFAEALMWLEDADTSEDKAMYNHVLRVVTALGNQEKAAELFSEKGNDDNAAPDPVVAFENAIAKAEEKGMSRPAAIAYVATNDPQLYVDYDKLTTKTIKSKEEDSG